MWAIEAKGMLAGAIVVVAVTADLGRSRTIELPAPSCAIEQTWTDGDQHFWETVELNAEGWGVWVSGGFDSDAEHAQRSFRWDRTDGELTFQFSGADRRTSHYTLESRGSYCSLVIDPTPFQCNATHALHLSNLPL